MINPTRIELRQSKTRLKSAIAGHKLLKDKLDEMVRRFLQLSRSAVQLRIDVEAQLTAALKSYALARAAGGGQTIDAALCMPTQPLGIEISSLSIMGVQTPLIRPIDKDGKITKLPYALAAAPIELYNAVIKFYAVIQRLLQLAEVEKTCALLADEMQKTRRRVNALEYVLIPDLRQTIKYIQMKLDENDRANLARLMKVITTDDNA